MFGRRPDGRKVKNIDPFMRIIPYIMKDRVDSQIFFDEEYDCGPMDEYIKAKRQEGIKLSYMTIIMAAFIRVIALKPALNRYVMRGRLFTRDKIWVSFAIQKDMRQGTSETTIKIPFEGTENIFDVAARIEEEIVKAQDINADTETDDMANLIMKLPGFLIRFVVNLLMWMDKWDMCPKAVLDASPFHTTVFLTNLKSLGINKVFHHIYNFGTTGIFIGLGKEKQKPAVAMGQMDKKWMCPMGVVVDERICDGMYFGQAFKQFRKYLKNPALLEERLEAKVEDVK